ncbi:MAG: hypothetical protein Q7K20_13995 [Polaromonas sp.]|jgi:hypothetical protein|nr:hypothetical protein [Polaromonas sp.]
MIVARVLILLLLLSAALSFVLYAVTGQPRYKRVGLNILRGTMIAGFVFFAVLIAQHLA